MSELEATTIHVTNESTIGVEETRSSLLSKSTRLECLSEDQTAGAWIVDCHAHLDDEQFGTSADDMRLVLKRAVDAGVAQIVAVSCDSSSASSVLALADSYASVAPCIGLHPQNFMRLANRRKVVASLPGNDIDIDGCKTDGAISHDSACSEVGGIDEAHAELNRVLDLIATHHERLVAVGECGLDFSPWLLDACDPDADKQRQRDAFSRQIDVAVQFNLPLNVHSRSAGKHAIDLLLQRAAMLGCTLNPKRHSVCFDDIAKSTQTIGNAKPFVPVLLHAFDGKPSVALRGAEAGFFFSVAPSICRSPHMQKLVRALPLHSLVVETDSPALAAEQNTRNEPALIKLSLEWIAQLKNLSADEVQEAVRVNQTRLFPRLNS